MTYSIRVSEKDLRHQAETQHFTTAWVYLVAELVVKDGDVLF